MLKTKSKLGLADVAVAKRQITNPFLDKINNIVDWDPIEKKINIAYSKGKRIDGRPAFPGLLLFKICLLKEWYNIPQWRLYLIVSDSISFTHFTGMSLDDEVPSLTTIQKFKIELSRKGLFSELLDDVSQSLSSHHLQIKKGITRHPILLRKATTD